MNREKLLIIFISIFFAVDFIRELLGFIHPNFINIISIFIGLVSLLLIKKITVNHKLIFLYISIVIFLTISLFNGIYKGFIDYQTIFYTFYKILELTIVIIIASNMSKRKLLLFYSKFTKLFYIIHTPLFLYYLLVLIGVLTYHNRIIVFDLVRFAGLSGEPAQYGQMSLIVLFMLITLKQNLNIKNIKSKTIIFLIFVLTSLSNAFFLSIIVFMIYYYNKQRISIIKLVFQYILAISVIIILFSINERLDIDLEQLSFIINNFRNLPHISVDGVGINSITTRFYEVLKSLSMTTNIIGHGLGSSLNYPIFSGELEVGQRINFYGISQVGYELGLLPMVLFITWFIKQIFYLKISLFNKSSLFTIFFVMLAVNGIAFKLYWFILFILIINTIGSNYENTTNKYSV